MHEKQVYRRYSDEFREVIEKFPKRTNNLLLVLVFVIIIIFFLLGWFIKSPDIILAEVKVTAEKPPVALVSKVSGNLKLKINNNNVDVSEGDYIAVIQNNSNEEQMKDLKEKLEGFSFDSIPNFKDYSFALNYNLGDIQNSYFEFVKTIYQLNQFYENNKYDFEIYSIKKQIHTINNSIVKRGEILDVKEKNIEISKNTVNTDSILVKKGAIIKLELEKSKKQLFSELEDRAFQENEVIKDQLNIVTLQDKISSLSIENKEVLENLNVTLLTNYQNLINGLNLWEQNYVFKAPFNGKLDYLKFVTNNQFIKQGEPLFSILPLNNTIIGQAFMPSDGAGKAKIGQNVTIKLDTYPYQEYGSLIGEIKSISLIPLEKVYLVNIDLPNGLKSDNDVNLNFSREMTGQAEIITEKRRLISRLFEKLKHAFDKKRRKDIVPEKETESQPNK